MSMPTPSPIVIFGIIFSLLVASLILIAYIRRRATRKAQEDIRERERLRAFEENALKEIQDQIGYSLDITHVVDMLLKNIASFIPYSACSSLIIKNDRMDFSTHLQERVSHAFVEDVKKSMIQSLHEVMNGTLPQRVDDVVLGTPIDENNSLFKSTYCNLPLLINDRPVGIISIASTKDNFYNADEVAVLYRITNYATLAVSRIEKVLTTEKSKLIAMVGSLADGVFMVDINSNLTVINEAARNFLDIKTDKPSIADVLSALPNTHNFDSKIKDVITQKRALEEKDVIVTDRTFKVFITPVFDMNQSASNDVIGASFLLHDVTLEKSVAQMKEDFTSVIVHDLRSPLTAIKASTELLSSTAQLTEEERSKLLRLIYDQSNRLLDQVTLILDSAKLEAGLFTIKKVPGDLKKVVSDRASIFAVQAQEKLINLVIDVDPTIPEFSFDPIQMGKVVTNLISNSMKFTPNGGTIKVSAKLMPGRVTISVSDTGAGIPQEKQHLLFTKFSQASTAGTQMGTGLGLYIVKGVVEAHGGTISLTSEEGHGTTISFTVPIERASASVAPQTNPLPASSSTTVH